MEEMQQAAEHDRDRIDRLLEEVESLRDSRNFAVDAEGQILDLNNKVRLLEEEAKLGKLFKVNNNIIHNNNKRQTPTAKTTKTPFKKDNTNNKNNTKKNTKNKHK